jgi:3-hydroxyisobutyrate/3-hydroxypropionate dehydrogenase
MGYAMATHVRKHIDSAAVLYVNDVFRPACERFKAAFEHIGPIEIADSAREVAESALTVVSIVPAGKDVNDVYLNGETGIIAARRPDSDVDSERLFIECSTIDVATAQDTGELLKNGGMGTYVDSPVSGGVPGAERGDLTFFLGLSDPEDTAGNASPLHTRVQTLCQCMGDPQKTFFCGGLGKGLAAKICNNYLSCTILLANCEAMATGIRMGLDKHLLFKIVHSSTGQNFMADHVFPVPGVVPHAPSSNNYKLGFKSQMLVKDVGLGVDAAHSVGIKPTIGEAAMEVYRKVAVDEGCSVSHTSGCYQG